MTPLIGYHAPRKTGARELAPPDVDVVELQLLLPRWQAEGLELVAREDGLTPGQLLRRLVRDALAARVDELD